MPIFANLWTREEVRLFVKTDAILFSKTILILISSWVFTRIFNFLILRVIFKEREGTIFESKKFLTLRAMLQSLIKYIVFFVAFLMILKLFDFPTESLLASAGVAGLAVGFGAQSLIKDVLSGFFIIFESQYSVGEYIKTANLEGIVEEVGLRATRIRDFNGGLHIIPNGHIDILTNFSRGKIRAMVDIAISYEEDIDKAMKVISKACEDVAKETPAILEGPTVLGVSKLGESEVTIRVLAFTKPMEQWAVERTMLKTIKAYLDDEGILIPYRHRIMLNYPAMAKENPRGEIND